MAKYGTSVKGPQAESAIERLERLTANEGWRNRVEDAIVAWHEGGSVRVVVEKSP